MIDTLYVGNSLYPSSASKTSSKSSSKSISCKKAVFSSSFAWFIINRPFAAKGHVIQNATLESSTPATSHKQWNSIVF